MKWIRPSHPFAKFAISVTLAAAILCCARIGSANADASDASTRPARPATLPARAVVRLDLDTQIVEAGLSPDGRTAHVIVVEKMIPLWKVFIHFWPEWGGGLAALLILVLVFTLWRAFPRRRTPGEPYCRKCNYQLTGCPSDRCPECGAELSKQGTVIGKSMRRRLALTAAIAAVISSVYGGLLLRVPRDGAVSTKFNWYSTQAYQRIRQSNKHPWLMQQAVTFQSLLEIDTHSGAIRRRWYSRPPESVSSMIELRNGQSVLLIFDTRFEQWDVTGGKLVHQWPIAKGHGGMLLSEDEKALYGLYGRYLSTISVRSWEVSTGQELPRIVLPPHRNEGGQWIYLLRVPGRQEMLVTSGEQVLVVDTQTGQIAREFKARPGHRFAHDIIVDSQGVMFATSHLAEMQWGRIYDNFERWDVRTGRSLADSIRFNLRGSPGAMALSTDGAVMYTASYQSNAADPLAQAWDTSTGACLANFYDDTQSRWNATLALSEDGGTLMARLFTWTPGPQVIQFHDTSGLPKAGTPAKNEEDRKDQK